MADRDENLRRTSCAAKLAVDSAVIAVAGLISPLREQRLAMRAMFAEGDFILVHVDVSADSQASSDIVSSVLAAPVFGRVIQGTWHLLLSPQQQ